LQIRVDGRMDLKEGAHFVGAFVSFPVQAQKRRVEILRSFLALEEKISSKRIKFGPILGRLTTASFTEKILRNALDSLEHGESDYLQFLNYNIGDDWVGAYQTSITLDWSSSVRPADSGESPVTRRFGDAGNLRIGYPQSRFLTNSESPFQKRLLDLLKTLWAESDLHWAFVHQGFHQLRPYSIGQDDVFRATRDGLPVTSFDHNLALPVGIHREYVGGAFWANFLNSFHVSRLGGPEKVLHEGPSEIVQHLTKDGMLLQVQESPLADDSKRSIEKYQRLRRFFAPILMETGEDMMRIQKEILESWRPPADAGRKWQEDLAMIRKQNP
jgi:hypothetical protein